MGENNKPKVLWDFKFQTVVWLLTIVVDDKEQKKPRLSQCSSDKHGNPSGEHNLKASSQENKKVPVAERKTGAVW